MLYYNWSGRERSVDLLSFVTINVAIVLCLSCQRPDRVCLFARCKYRHRPKGLIRLVVKRLNINAYVYF